MPDLDPDTFSALADVLGGAAKSGASANSYRDALKIAVENAKLNRDKFALTAPGARLDTGIRSSLAAHATAPVMHWGGPGSGLKGQIPTISGGASSFFDALKDPQTKSLIDRVMSDTTASQKAGGLTGGGGDTAMPTGIGQTSLMDKVLGGGALTSGVLGALGKGGSGGSINLSDLFGSIFKHGDSGPTSVPGGSSDFPDWAYNTGSTNPEDLPFGPNFDPTKLPGAGGGEPSTNADDWNF